MERKQVVSEELNALSKQVIGAAIAVHRELGPGFAEATYSKALQIELRHRNIHFRLEVPVQLKYRNQVIGEGRVDILVEEKLVLELKAVDGSSRQYRRQASAYLKAMDLALALIINFETPVLRDNITRVIHVPQ